MANIGSVGADGVGIQDWRDALQGVVKSWKAISKSEEFDALMASALGALQGVVKSWQAVSKSDEFKALMASALPAGGDTMKQAGGSFIRAVSALLADRTVLKSWDAISQSEEFKSL